MPWPYKSVQGKISWRGKMYRHRVIGKDLKQSKVKKQNIEQQRKFKPKKQQMIRYKKMFKLKYKIIKCLHEMPRHPLLHRSECRLFRSGYVSYLETYTYN